MPPPFPFPPSVIKYRTVSASAFSMMLPMWRSQPSPPPAAGNQTQVQLVAGAKSGSGQPQGTKEGGQVRARSKGSVLTAASALPVNGRQPWGPRGLFPLEGLRVLVLAGLRSKSGMGCLAASPGHEIRSFVGPVCDRQANGPHGGKLARSSETRQSGPLLRIVMCKNIGKKAERCGL